MQNVMLIGIDLGKHYTAQSFHRRNYCLLAGRANSLIILTDSASFSLVMQEKSIFGDAHHRVPHPAGVHRLLPALTK